jgi:hypothetical protein
MARVTLIDGIIYYPNGGSWEVGYPVFDFKADDTEFTIRYQWPVAGWESISRRPNDRDPWLHWNINARRGTHISISDDQRTLELPNGRVKVRENIVGVAQAMNCANIFVVLLNKGAGPDNLFAVDERGNVVWTIGPATNFLGEPGPYFDMFYTSECSLLADNAERFTAVVDPGTGLISTCFLTR